MGSDKGGISALRLSKFIGFTWRSAYRMLTKLRTVMGHRDSIYRLSEVIELDDALIGGKKAGKIGRGAEGKVSVLIACENIDDRAGFMAMEAVESVSKKAIESFAKRRILANQEVHTDGLHANKGVTPHVTHISKVTPPEMVDEWLTWVLIAISNLKRFLLGTFYGTTKCYLQNYLNEFCYRFNRRFWEAETPNRLMRLCVDHRPI